MGPHVFMCPLNYPQRLKTQMSPLFLIQLRKQSWINNDFYKANRQDKYAHSSPLLLCCFPFSKDYSSSLLHRTVILSLSASRKRPQNSSIAPPGLRVAGQQSPTGGHHQLTPSAPAVTRLHTALSTPWLIYKNSVSTHKLCTPTIKTHGFSDLLL